MFGTNAFYADVTLPLIDCVSIKDKVRWDGPAKPTQLSQRLRSCAATVAKSALLRRLDDESHVDAKPRQHIDERIGAEPPEASAPKLVDAASADA